LGLARPPVERRLPHTESPFGTYRFKRNWDDHAAY
jgi:hypothetical protein